eukprot:314528-Amphidinium_carterae.1
MTVATPGTANTMSEYASMLESLVMAAQAARSLPLQVSERCRAKMAFAPVHYGHGVFQISQTLQPHTITKHV